MSTNLILVFQTQAYSQKPARQFSYLDIYNVLNTHWRGRFTCSFSVYWVHDSKCTGDWEVVKMSHFSETFGPEMCCTTFQLWGYAARPGSQRMSRCVFSWLPGLEAEWSMQEEWAWERWTRRTKSGLCAGWLNNIIRAGLQEQVFQWERRGTGSDVRHKSKMKFQFGWSKVVWGIHWKSLGSWAFCWCWQETASWLTDLGLGWPGTSKDEISIRLIHRDTVQIVSYKTLDWAHPFLLTFFFQQEKYF